jgi:hypothetical protein
MYFLHIILKFNITFSRKEQEIIRLFSCSSLEELDMDDSFNDDDIDSKDLGQAGKEGNNKNSGRDGKK